MKVIVLANSIFFFIATWGLFDHLTETGKMNSYKAFAIGFVAAIQVVMSILTWRKHR